MTYDQKLERIQGWIMSTLTRLGVFFVPTMPASFLGYAVYKQYDGNPFVGMWFGFICSVAYEVVGIVVSEKTLKAIDNWQLRNARAWKAILMGTILPLSSVVIALAVYYSDTAFTPLIKGIGMSGSFMTMFIYITIAVDRSIDATIAKKLLEKAERKAEKLANKPSEKASHRKSSAESEKEDGLRKELLPRPNWMDFTPRMKFEFVAGVKDGAIRLPAGIKAPELAQYVPVSVRSCQDWLNEIKNGEAFV